MIRTTERTSRKQRRCGCGNGIRPGERYVEHVASPGTEDLDNTRWWRLPECAECAIRYGRMTDPTPDPETATRKDQPSL